VERDRNYANAVVRACEVMKAFQKDGEALSLAELVERTRLSKTTTFRLVQSLVRGGLMERVGKGVYSSRVRALPQREYRLGFAAQGDSAFSREVTTSLERAAARANVELITVNNRYSAKEALKNADLLIRERVDLVLEYQTYERVAPVIASKFVEANIPVIAIEIPHPGASFFGANNYQAGLMGERALGRITGMVDGLRRELPATVHTPVVHLDGKGNVEDILTVVRRFLRRAPAKRTLVGAVNDLCALAALRGFEEAGAGQMCAVAGQNAIPEARRELRRPGTRLVCTVAFFPERYEEQLVPLALNILQKKAAPGDGVRGAPIDYAEECELDLPAGRAERGGGSEPCRTGD